VNARRIAYISDNASYNPVSGLMQMHARAASACQGCQSGPASQSGAMAFGCACIMRCHMHRILKGRIQQLCETRVRSTNHHITRQSQASREFESPARNARQSICWWISRHPGVWARTGVSLGSESRPSKVSNGQPWITRTACRY
jgi:hypothetical protein